jgi:cell division transport system permease protein
VKRLAARLEYVVRAALRGFVSGPVTSGVAVSTIAISLVLVGAFALLLSNMRSLLDEFGDRLVVVAYLEHDLSTEQWGELADLAATVEGVDRAIVVSKEAALERFSAGVGRGAALLEGLSENPLPASIEISLVPEQRSAEGLARVAGALEGLPGIEEISSGRDWVEGYLRAVSLVRAVAIGLGGILGFAALMIVSNTIRLAIVSRRDELELLSLVGASRSFIGAPFLLEGVIQGTLGGGTALVVLCALFQLVLPGFEFGLEMLLGGVSPVFFSSAGCLFVLFGGAGLGLLGSIAALASERFA